jgi:hypothetical protein
MTRRWTSTARRLAGIHGVAAALPACGGAWGRGGCAASIDGQAP